MTTTVHCSRDSIQSRLEALWFHLDRFSGHRIWHHIDIVGLHLQLHWIDRESNIPGTRRRWSITWSCVYSESGSSPDTKVDYHSSLITNNILVLPQKGVRSPHRNILWHISRVGWSMCVSFISLGDI